MAPMNRQMQITVISDHWLAPQRFTVVVARSPARANTGA